jgi:YesN/AraC family two-component response regulator
MRKVVIVDDEIWIRRGLIQSIPWDRFGFRLVGEAGDGEEAHRIALAEKPDLLFLDMRMPGLDGKQLLGMLRRDLPDLLTIVVSGYSDYEYMKEAIRQKAFDYLLKPVKKDELVSVLERAVEKMKQQEKKKSTGQFDSKEDWLQRILYHAVTDVEAREKEGEIPLPEGWPCGETYVMVGQRDTFRDGSESSNLVGQLRELLTRNQPFLFGGEWNFVVTTAPDANREFVIVIVGERLQQEEIYKLSHIVQRTLKQEEIGSYSLGIGMKREDAHYLRRAYLEAGQALKKKRLGVLGTVLWADNDMSKQRVNYPQEKENAFLRSLQMGNKEGAQHESDMLFAAISEDSMTVDHLQRSAFLLVHSIEKQLRGTESRLEEVCGKNPQMYTEMIQHRNDAAAVKRIFDEEIIPSVLAYYKRSREKQGKKIVRLIQNMIENNYDQPLSLQQIAESHYMNTDYVSRLFKKSTGHNFVDYMTNFRINKSKELMKLSAYKNYEIAHMVGYEDYRYFSQIFKKKTGMTIGEYRVAAETVNH